MYKRLLVLTIVIFAIAQVSAKAFEGSNERPVIGILTIPSEYDQYPANDWNYMAASYVKYLESAGARVVPVQWDLPLENFTRIMRSLNGFLITGGDSDHVKADNKTLTPFGVAVQNVVNTVIQINNEGVHYPLWGTCMGFQLISCIIAGQTSGDYNCLYVQPGFSQIRTNMSFFEGAEKHPIFSKMTNDLHDAFLHDDITFFHFSVTVHRYLWEENSGLKTNFTRLTYVLDEAATNITVLIAGTKYPIYGSQFHPEKIPFEWRREEIPHSRQAVSGAQMYANFFVDEARKNFNSFNGSGIDLDSVIIYNYDPVKLTDASFEQIYFFHRIQPGPLYFLDEANGAFDDLEFLNIKA